MAVKKMGDRWYYDFMIRRIRYRGVIPEAMNKAQAEKAETKIRFEVYEGRYGKPTGDACFIDYAETVFLSWSKNNKRSYTNDYYHIKTFKAYFGKKSFKQITPMLLEKFKQERRNGTTFYGTERKPASVNRELELLSKIFNMAIRDGLAEINPCEKVQKLREDNQRVRYLLPDEEERLMAALTGPRTYLKPIVLLAIHTGMRRGEILNLKWANVDFSREVIHVVKTKNGKDRFVPMNEVVRTELLLLQEKRNGSDVVFVSMRTNGVLKEIKKGFAAARREAGIENLTFHDLRHTTGTRLADSGVDAFTIAEILGHQDLRMTKRYTHATDERKQSAMEKLANYSPADNCQKIVKNEKR
jgi:integrase